MLACYGCGQPPSKAASRHFPASSATSAAPGAAAAAAPRRGWGVSPTPPTVANSATWHDVPRGKKAKQRSRASGNAAASSVPAAGDPPPSVESVDDDLEVPGITIAELQKLITVLEPAAELVPAVAEVLAEKRKLLLGMQAEKRAAKDPKIRHLEASRKKQQGLVREAKSLKALADLHAAHALLVDKHQVEVAAAEAVLAADRLALAAAAQELVDCLKVASLAAGVPVQILSPAAEAIAARIRDDSEALQAQLAIDNAAPAASGAALPLPVNGLPAAPPPPVTGLADGATFPSPSSEEVLIAANKAEQERNAIEVERLEHEARSAHEAANNTDVGMADAEKKRLAEAADEAESRVKKCKTAVGAAGIKQASG
jgi:hypothetical protein